MDKLIYLEQAKDDLLQIKSYIAKESGSHQVALNYTYRIRKQCQKLAMLPGQLGRERPELYAGLRSFPVDNYIIFFRYIKDTVEIVSIIEGHRDVTTVFDKI